MRKLSGGLDRQRPAWLAPPLHLWAQVPPSLPQQRGDGGGVCSSFKTSMRWYILSLRVVYTCTIFILMIVNPIPSHQVPNPPYLHQVHLPLTEFAAFFRGQQVEDAPPLDLTKVNPIHQISCANDISPQIGAFGLQTFGGVYDEFKQSGVGTLEIDSISLYWPFFLTNLFCTFESNILVPNIFAVGLVWCDG